MLFILSVVIYHFNIICVTVTLRETEPPLVVYANTVLHGAVAGQLFQSIRWGNRQIVQFIHRVKDFELNARPPHPNFTSL